MAQNGGAARHCAVETCNCHGRQLQRPGRRGLAAERLRPALRLRGADRALRRPRQQLRRRHRRRLHGRRVLHRTTASAPAAAAASWPATPTGTGTFCDAPTVTPQPEVCNGIDDNCNGMIDEGTLPGVGEKCGNGLGTCSSGTFVCTNGQLVCNATGMPQAETCNGIDDNCDGVIDNGNLPADRSDLPLPGADPGADRRARQHLQGRPASSAAARWASCARAACCRRPRSATARTTTATA